MPKLDLKKEFKTLYNPSSKEVALVDVPPIHFLMIDGSGYPGDNPEYQAALEALYAVSYTLKFMLKGRGADYTVMPLEGLWWADDMSQFSMEAKHLWRWTALIAQPDQVTEALYHEAVEEVRRKKNPAALDRMRFEQYHEGLAAQIMYFGPYSAEGPTIARLHAWITEHGYDYHGAGKHHEIYLSDPRKTAPEKLRTVIRQPMIKAKS
jgi:hypothetical protein